MSRIVPIAKQLGAALRPGTPRTVIGPSNHVVIIGGGLAGLSAAMHLRGAGREVTLLERESIPGGRAGTLQLQGASGSYTCDTGPTVLTMPGLIADCFDALGEDMDSWLTMTPVDPLYEARFADGSRLRLHAEVERSAAAIADFSGPAEADRYRKLVDYLHKLYTAEMKDFIDSNIDTPADLITPNLAKLIGLGGFGKLAPKIESFLHDERLQRLFSFQSLYAGVSPYDALALYAVIAYMDSVAGVYFPSGGMNAIPTAMAAAAEKHGVRIHYGRTVTAIEHSGGRASAVICADGERIACDALVATPDLPVAREQLLGKPLKRKLTYSPSCWLLLAGSTTSYENLAHHTICFGDAWREVFEDLNGGRLMRDPSILVSCPTVSDPGLAPAGAQTYYVLLPTPNTQAPIDWDRIGDEYFDHAMSSLERHGFTGFEQGLEATHVTNPTDWEAMGMAAGTPFAASHLLSQTGPFRPSNIWGENVVFAGSGTQPGVGVPMVLISGRLAAERIVGHMPNYSSRGWPENA